MPVFRSLQYLRAAAALAVVAFHAAQRAGGSVGIGAAGVDVFFVISGFIMWSVTDRRAVSPGRFMLHRVIRVVPLYWLVTLAMAAAAGTELFPNLRAPGGHVLLSLLFVPHADPAGAAFPLLVPGWTLDYEMAFYLVYAAILPLPRGRLAVLAAVLIGLVAVGATIRPTGLWQTYTDPIMLEFAAGAALGATTRRLPRGWGRAMLAAGLMAFAVQAALPASGPAWRLLAWGVPALLVVAGALGIEATRQPTRPTRPARAWAVWPGRALLRLGDASYSIYLLHGLVVSACWRLLPAMPVAGFVAACLAGSAAIGLVCFAAIERPMTVALRHATRAPGLASRPAGR